MKIENNAASPAPRLIRGLAVSGGIAIGPAFIVEHASGVQVPEYTLEPDAVEAERERFLEALAKARRQLRKLKTKASVLPDDAAEEVAILLDAHLAMLSGSRLTRGVEDRIVQKHQNAEYAVKAEIATIAQTFSGMNDSYLAARIADVHEVGGRLIRNLMKHAFAGFSTVPKGSILVAEELTPADTAVMNPSVIGGFATVLGGIDGHTAIMARSLGLPAVLGVSGLLPGIHQGDMIIVDGEAGHVLLNPTQDAIAEYRTRQEALLFEQNRLLGMGLAPAETLDGAHIILNANLERPSELDSALRHGADGVGLLRTEFMFMGRPTLPSEEEQYTALKALVVGLNGRTLTARTFDLGGEKLAEGLQKTYNECANPALGLRAIRLGLQEPLLLETQLAAMIRAAAFGPLRILLPLVTSVDEVLAVRAMIAQVAERLRQRGEAVPDTLPPLGVMIETPAAALIADSLAEVSDFFSIGTNDLTQYTLAVDRSDEQVTSLYNALHPAVLRLIRMTVESALRARLPVSVCGEIGGDPRVTPVLLGLGVREISMSIAALPKIKSRVRALHVGMALSQTHLVMEQTNTQQIEALLDGF